MYIFSIVLSFIYYVVPGSTGILGCIGTKLLGGLMLVASNSMSNAHSLKIIHSVLTAIFQVDLG